MAILPWPAFAESKPSAQDIAAIVQAVENEIYDYDVPLYISSEMYDDGHGVVIYRFMPFGEVQRRFAIKNDVTAVLWGRPLNRFPATQPDTNTLYLRDEDVCNFKVKAIKTIFTVDPNVPIQRKKDAAGRQLSRIGFSQFLDEGKKESQHN